MEVKAQGKEANGGAHSHYENPYMRKPTTRSLLETLRLAVWNPQERTVLGRTAKRWGVIGLIYVIMYICIVIFFSLCMCGLLATIDPRVPRYRLADSIIGKNPGLGFRPIVFEEGSLIWYATNQTERMKKYVNSINEFLAPYKNKTLLPNKGNNQVPCGLGRPPENMSCAVDVTNLGPCVQERHFGYNDTKPCIFIKLNKIYDWVPEYYDDPNNLPEDMPDHLKEYIKSLKTQEERKQVWMTCFGERPADNETIGELQYYPGPGVPARYFPYTNTPDYLSPVVAVHFLNPGRSQVINVRCRGWAKNLEFANSLGFSNDRLGSCHIEILVD